MGKRYTVLVQNSTAAATTLTWIVDRDSLLVGATSWLSNAVVSDDPSFTVALMGTPTSTRSLEKFICPCVLIGFTWNIFLPKGTKLYLAFSAKDTATLLFEESDLA
jgi:hypothetical protein